MFPKTEVALSGEPPPFQVSLERISKLRTEECASPSAELSQQASAGIAWIPPCCWLKDPTLWILGGYKILRTQKSTCVLDCPEMVGWEDCADGTPYN